MYAIKPHFGPPYQIDIEGNGVISAALEEGLPYEHKLLNHIYKQGYRGRAVDVGAHVGNHTVFLALACQLKVHAFEPIEFKQLVRNLDLNGIWGDSDKYDGGSAFAFNCALSDGIRRYKSVGKGILAEDGTGAVESRTLDWFHLDDVSMIKIDVEGMEPEVLRGAEKTIDRCKPVIYAEAQDAHAHALNEEVLNAFGYKPTGAVFGATPMEEWACR